MGKGSKMGCKSASHQLFKDKAKNRVDDLQGMFTDLQFARKESRVSDVAVLEEQVHQMLREWRAELNEASPASSLHGNSLGSSNLSSDIRRLLQLCEEEDDATSALAAPAGPKPEPDVHGVQVGGDNAAFQDEYFVNQAPQACGFQEVDHCKGTPSAGLHHTVMNTQLEYHQFDLHQDFPHNIFIGCYGTGQCGEDAIPNISTFPPRICPSPSAFLGPKCALWDCPRPAQGADWCQDYCSSFHATLAMNEGPPGMTPVLRPGGIDLKDGPLFAALTAKTQGKDVGIPECEGAATTKSPWNAPELFNLSVLEGETIREWLFFDKPRRAFESGNRKQRSLPDYSGRGWHESRKQVMKEFGGLKRSYYMDPQPLNNFEWHLYEYEINNCDACALYRLELKLVDAKKSPKGKVSSDSLVDLQQQMGRLSAEFPADNKRSVKGRAKANPKDSAGNVYPAPNQMAPVNENIGYEVNVPYGYLVESLNDYYGT
ncbi:transcription factor VOZ1 isoform X2 [Magnolia sinica]|uniref:transcription factor VOZ1 isoform X2 n=1 Tax=Magnolia sinica TaxID=86752 RepID=UPI00265B2442|nr:transcription factor VOZ1 isoform X2 [Magnolia sinica]